MPNAMVKTRSDVIPDVKVALGADRNAQIQSPRTDHDVLERRAKGIEGVLQEVLIHITTNNNLALLKVQTEVGNLGQEQSSAYE
eukprot:6456524-Pyramimonas_sp.AAC.1